MGTLYAAINVERRHVYYLGKSIFFHEFVQKLIETRGNVVEARIWAENRVSNSGAKDFVLWADEFIPRVAQMSPDFVINDGMEEWDEEYANFLVVGTIFYDDGERIGKPLSWTGHEPSES